MVDIKEARSGGRGESGLNDRLGVVAAARNRYKPNHRHMIMERDRV